MNSDIKAALAVAGAIGMLATAHGALASMEKSDLKKITGQPLKSLMVGASVTESYAGVKSHLIEEFSDDGTWQKIGTRAPLYGSYEILKDKICVEYPKNTKSCRFVYKSTANGKFYTRVVGREPSVAVEIAIDKVK